jgi:hypothetical protein
MSHYFFHKTLKKFHKPRVRLWRNDFKKMITMGANTDNSGRHVVLKSKADMILSMRQAHINDKIEHALQKDNETILHFIAMAKLRYARL